MVSKSIAQLQKLLEGMCVQQNLYGKGRDEGGGGGGGCVCVCVHTI